MDTDLAVNVIHLFKTFEGKEVIQDCSMSVERGTIYGFLGKNGAGKTTVFKILLGLLKPTMGQAVVLGMDSVKNNLDILRRTGSLIKPLFSMNICPPPKICKFTWTTWESPMPILTVRLNRSACRIWERRRSQHFLSVCVSG